LAMEVGEKTFRNKDIVSPVGGAGVSIFFIVNTMAAYVRVGETARLKDFGNPGGSEANNFIEVTHENDVGMVAVICRN
jgi:hypothetical protein